MTWACWDSAFGKKRGVLVVVGALYVLFLMRRFPFGDGSVAQKLMHFCPPGIPKELVNTGHRCLNTPENMFHSEVLVVVALQRMPD